MATNSHTPVDIDVTANDSAPAGFALPITILDQPGKANANLATDGHTVHYVPNNQKGGQYVFHYQVCNAAGGCAKGTVTVTVT